MILASLVVMAGIGGLVKSLAGDISIAQILLFRYTLATLPFLLLLPRHGGVDALRVRNHVGLMIRTVSGITALAFYFYTIATIPLADATALAYAAPVFIVVLSIPVLGEKIGVQRWSAVAAGFIGVLLIAQPAGTGAYLGYLAGIGSAFFGAVVSVWLRVLAPTERTSTIAIYYNAAGAAVFACWVLVAGWISPTVSQLLLLLLLGALAGVQQYLLTAAYRFSEASLLAPFDYAAMIIAAAVGYLFWAEVPAVMTWVGCGIIALSGIFVAHRERVQAQAKKGS